MLQVKKQLPTPGALPPAPLPCRPSALSGRGHADGEESVCPCPPGLYRALHSAWRAELNTCLRREEGATIQHRCSLPLGPREFKMFHLGLL